MDDAVFSCAAVLERTDPIDVYTVCAGFPEPPVTTWWDERCGFRDSTEGIAERRREDAAAFAGTPHRSTYLDLLELQYVGERDPSESGLVAAAVAAWLERFPRGVVIVPAGAGRRIGLADRIRFRLGRTQSGWTQHPDHAFVRDAALDALAGSDATVILYEELPYLLGEPSDAEVERIARRRGWRLEPVVEEVDRDRKVVRIRAYASQIRALSSPEQPLDDAATLPAEERYWRVVRSPVSSR